MNSETQFIYVCPKCGWIGEYQEAHNLHIEECYAE